MIIKKLLSIALVSSVLIGSFGCKTRPPQEGTTFVAAFESDIPALDTIQVGDTTSHDVAYNIYNALVTYRAEITKEGEKLIDLVPDLAEKWDVSPDGKKYTFHLRKGVKFHNDRELIADDVKYSYERLANPKNASKGLWTTEAVEIKGLKKFVEECKAEKKDAHLEGIKVIDKYTVEIEFEKMIPFALHVLAMPYYFIVPKEEVEKWGQEFNTHPVGTGPYKFKEWKRGKSLELVKNKNYFEKGLPYIDNLVYEIVPNDVVRYGRFMNGQLDFVDNTSIPSSKFEALINDEAFSKLGAFKIRTLPEIEDLSQSLIMKKPILSTEYLGMNITKEPFNDKKVRQALNYAIDKQKIVDKVYAGKRTIARGVLPPGFPGFNEENKVPYPYDPDKAKQLLEEAGWKDSDGDGFLDKNGKKLILNLWYNQREVLALLCSSVQADLKYLGIDVELNSQQWAPYVEKIRKGEANFFRFGWSADYPDPDNFLWTLFSKQNIGQDNATNYNNPEVDKLLNEARTSFDWKKREKLYQSAEKIIVDDAPWIFLENEVQYKVVQKGIEGLHIHPLLQNVMKIVKKK
ncbi:MAG: ABC transporter substrate-binding protein [Candidatus Sericytochromatia bacterium]